MGEYVSNCAEAIELAGCERRGWFSPVGFSQGLLGAYAIFGWEFSHATTGDIVPAVDLLTIEVERGDGVGEAVVRPEPSCFCEPERVSGIGARDVTGRKYERIRHAEMVVDLSPLQL